MFFPKQTEKISSYTNNLFTTKISKHRAVFFVFLAVLIFGFSCNIALAVKLTSTPPAPGTPYAQWPPEWKNAAGADKYLQSGAPSYNTNGSNVEYAQFLRSVGGFTSAEATSYTSSLNPNSPNIVDRALVSGSQLASSAGTALGKGLAEGVMAIIIGVLAIIAYFCKLFLMFAGWTLDFTLNPAIYNFTSNPMITQGWIIVRDVCNLFFLLILLFIAICTILKIEKYHAKKTLLMLIIMALLINFSKPIAVFIFDASQLLMGEFLRQLTGNSQSPSAMYAQASDIAKFMYDDFQGYFGSDSSSIEIAVQYLFVIIFLFMFAVALFVTALFLIIRIVAVMLLIIVSPFAFLAAAVPDFSKMSSKWWSALFEYSFYGPAAAFFLLLATKLSNVLTTTINAPSSMPGLGGNITQHIIQYFVVLVFLYISIIMAKQMGLFAGAAVVGNANKFMKWAGGWSKGGGMWGGAARVTGVADAYKGTKAGVARQPGWRVFTKEGREAASKERQERWEGRIAPFNIADAKKRQKELENVDLGKINTGVNKGDPASILEAAKRGKITDIQLQSAPVRKLMANADFEAATYKNLRDSGNGHLQYSDLLSRGKSTVEAFDATFKGMSTNVLSEQNKLDTALRAEAAAGGNELYTKLNNISTLPPLQRERMVGPLLTRAKDPDTIAVLTRLYNGLPPI